MSLEKPADSRIAGADTARGLLNIPQPLTTQDGQYVFVLPISLIALMLS